MMKSIALTSSTSFSMRPRTRVESSLSRTCAVRCDRIHKHKHNSREGRVTIVLNTVLITVCWQVDTFMFEGHDTTGSGLTWAIYLIASHPEVQQKIVDELEEVLGTCHQTTRPLPVQ